jgi:superfamily II DNA or RNA helicase
MARDPFVPRAYQTQDAEDVFQMLTRPKAQGNSAAGQFSSIGAGKTATTIMVMERMFREGHAKNALILAPVRVVYDTWMEEIPWVSASIGGHKLRPTIIHGMTTLGPKRQIELQSLDSVHKLFEEYTGRWDWIIVDESRNFADWSSRRMRSLRKLLKKCKYRTILTGTPTPEHYGELFSQMFILDKGELFGKSVTQFRKDYMDGEWTGHRWKWTFRDAQKEEAMKKVTKYVIRTDATTHPDFPKLVENNVWVPMPDAIKADYEKLKRELVLALEGGETLIANHAAGLYGKLKQYACGQVYVGSLEEGTRESVQVHAEKIKALKEILSELYGHGSIILYWCKHDKDRIVKELKAMKIDGRARKVAVIDGETSGEESSKIIKLWNERKIDNIVSHPKCMGEGLNMQRGGCHMIFFAIPDSNNMYLQTRGRVHRPGNVEGTAYIHRIAMRDTVEEVQIDRLDGKIKNQDEFLNALKNHARGIK